MSAQAAGPVLFVWCQTALGWRAPWLAAAAATLAFVAAPLAVRVAVPLPPDTFMPARAFEVRLFGAAPPLGGDPGAGKALVDGAGDAGDAAPLAVAEPGDAAPLAVAAPADGATTV